MFPLSKVNINWPFLRAAAQSWDPNVHVFRFGHQELCPTFEEFEALLEVHPCTDLVHPTTLVSYLRLLEEVCGWLLGKAKACIPNFSLLLVDVVKQVSQGKGFVGLVLAKTLMGLDAAYDGETTYFASSPLLLLLVKLDTMMIGMIGCVAEHKEILLGVVLG
ncbi:hypothetical protein ACSBR2_015213 [Camellia fascicularis]